MSLLSWLKTEWKEMRRFHAAARAEQERASVGGVWVVIGDLAAELAADLAEIYDDLTVYALVPSAVIAKRLARTKSKNFHVTLYTAHEVDHTPLLNLETFLRENEISRVDYLKIDTRGGELALLKSAGPLISRVKVIQIAGMGILAAKDV